MSARGWHDLDLQAQSLFGNGIVNHRVESQLSLTKNDSRVYYRCKSLLTRWQAKTPARSPDAHDFLVMQTIANKPNSFPSARFGASRYTSPRLANQTSLLVRKREHYIQICTQACMHDILHENAENPSL